MSVVTPKVHMTERLHKRVRNAMRKRNLNAFRLAKRVKVDESVITQWLLGYGLAADVYRDVCEVLNLPKETT